MKLLRLGFSLFLLGVSFGINAQGLPDIEKLLESNNIESTEEGYEEMVSTLLQLLSSPININTADFDSLKLLFFLSDSQIDELLAFRRKQGNFMHLNELLLVPGISRQDVENIRPFIKLEDQQQTLEEKHWWRHELLARARITLPKQEGYKIYSPKDFDKQKEYERKVENRFYGPPFGTMIKYKTTYGRHFQAGITLENDAGEGYFTADQKTGFDFLSAHVSITSKRFLQQMVIGDYRLQWGQGLVAWGGFSSGKSGVVLGNEKSGKGFAPYSSTDENNYLRGIAVSFRPIKHLSADLIFSRKKTDGTLTPSDTVAEEDLFSVSLYETGYHRNHTECRKKHTLKETTAGISVHWNTAYFKIGMNALYYDFSPALIPGDRLYQQYNDTGNKRRLMSVDYKTSLWGIYLFGETAYSDDRALATVNGLRMSSSFLSGCVLYRRYDKGYVSHYASGFGEYSNTSNEEGWYCGVNITPMNRLKINAYYDWFRFFSPRYRASTPDSGWKIWTEAEYHHHKCDHTFRYKHEIHPEDLQGGAPSKREKSEYRYQFAYRQSDCLELRTRCTFSQYRKEVVKEHGYMIYQDVIYASRKDNFKMQYRLGWFDTDSYQSRIYAYENNVLYGYSFPSFMGKGWRTYINLNWRPIKRITCYLKTGFIIYPDRDSISSGVTEVKGNKLYDLTLQIRISI